MFDNCPYKAGLKFSVLVERDEGIYERLEDLRDTLRERSRSRKSGGSFTQRPRQAIEFQNEETPRKNRHTINPHEFVAMWEERVRRDEENDDYADLNEHQSENYHSKNNYYQTSPRSGHQYSRENSLLNQKRNAVRQSKLLEKRSSTADKRAHNSKQPGLLPAPRKLNLVAQPSRSRGTSQYHKQVLKPSGSNISFQAYNNESESSDMQMEKTIRRDPSGHFNHAVDHPQTRPYSHRASNTHIPKAESPHYRTPYLASLKHDNSSKIFKDVLHKIEIEVEKALEAVEKENLLLRTNVRQLTKELADERVLIDDLEGQLRSRNGHKSTSSLIEQSRLSLVNLSNVNYFPRVDPLSKNNYKSSQRSIKTTSTSAQTQVSSSDLEEFDQWKRGNHNSKSDVVKSSFEIFSPISISKIAYEQLNTIVRPPKAINIQRSQPKLSIRPSIITRNFKAHYPKASQKHQTSKYQPISLLQEDKRVNLTIALLEPIEIVSGSTLNSISYTDDDYQRISSPKRYESQAAYRQSDSKAIDDKLSDIEAMIEAADERDRESKLLAKKLEAKKNALDVKELELNDLEDALKAKGAKLNIAARLKEVEKVLEAREDDESGQEEEKLKKGLKGLISNKTSKPNLSLKQHKPTADHNLYPGMKVEKITFNIPGAKDEASGEEEAEGEEEHAILDRDDSNSALSSAAKRKTGYKKRDSQSDVSEEEDVEEASKFGSASSASLGQRRLEKQIKLTRTMIIAKKEIEEKLGEAEKVNSVLTEERDKLKAALEAAKKEMESLNKLAQNPKLSIAVSPQFDAFEDLVAENHLEKPTGIKESIPPSSQIDIKDEDKQSTNENDTTKAQATMVK